MHGDAVRWLDRAAVIAAGGSDFALAVEDVRTTLALLRNSQATMPAENSVALDMDGAADARVYALPAGLGAPYDSVGVKWTAHRAAAAGEPRIMSLTVVNDRRTGAPIGIVESALLTAMRTAAVSATAIVAAAPRPVRRVALLGAGMQARAHLAMLAQLFPGLEAVRAWNRSPPRLARMLARYATPPWPIERCATAQAAVDGVDVVLSCTAATSPILDAWVVRPGRIVLQIGYHEASFDAIDASTAVVVDLWGEFRLASAKSLFQAHRAGRFAAERVAADLAAAVHGGWRPHENDAVYFNSFGLNVFDVALATRVLRHAAALGLGSLLPFAGGGEIPW
jgi:ornithine cyclodeaminase